MKTYLTNLIIPLALLGSIRLLSTSLGFGHPLGGVLIAIALYFLAQLIRNSKLFTLLGLPEVASPGDMTKSKANTISFLVRKSMWFVIPFLYIVINQGASFKDFGILLPLATKTQLILLVVLAALSALMFLDAKKMGISVPTYLKSFGLSCLAAGFPEDLLIIGLIGGRTLNLALTFLPSLGAQIFTLVVVESLFTLSHIPSVKKAHDFYSERMTTKKGMSYQRMFVQMFLFSLPGWIFYFLSSHIFFSIWWHSLGDIAAFLPPKTEE